MLEYTYWLFKKRGKLMLLNKSLLTEKIIKEWVNNLTNRLRLKPIKIDFDKEDNHASYDFALKTFIFGGRMLKNLEDTDLWANTFPSSAITFYDKLYCIVAHECAHYLQYSKFPQWHWKYTNKNCHLSFRGVEAHHKRKIERNAQKIAHILFREYKGT